MKSTLLRAVVALAVFVLGAGHVLAGDVVGLRSAVARLNQGLPRMVAKDLRQEVAYVQGMTLIFNYTHLSLTSSDLRRMNLAQTQLPYILPGLCSAADTGRMLREGIQFRYVYTARDGGVGADFVLAKSDC